MTAGLPRSATTTRSWRRGTVARRSSTPSGRTVLPGFIEPHNHMVGYSTNLLEVDVRTPPNRNIGDIVDRLRERASSTPPGEWVRGRGYDDTGLQDMRHPTRHDLDDASTDHPIAIVHNSGHMLAANSVALEMAGIHDETPDPPGGRIGRFPASGEPDGMLYETAQALVHQLLPAYTEDDVRTGFVRAQDEYLRRGITTIHDASVGNARGVDILDTYQRAKYEGFLKFRVNMFMQWEYLKQSDFALKSGDGDEWVRVAGCKIISDGSIQGITAALREPYHCDPDEQGWLIYEQDELNDMVMTLHRLGLPDRHPCQRRRGYRRRTDCLRERAPDHSEGRPPVPHRALPGLPAGAHLEDARPRGDPGLLPEPRLLLRRPAPGAIPGA